MDKLGPRSSSGQARFEVVQRTSSVRGRPADKLVRLSKGTRKPSCVLFLFNYKFAICACICDARACTDNASQQLLLDLWRGAGRWAGQEDL